MSSSSLSRGMQHVMNSQEKKAGQFCAYKLCENVMTLQGGLQVSYFVL
jgi:hypothetical protein